MRPQLLPYFWRQILLEGEIDGVLRCQSRTIRSLGSSLMDAAAAFRGLDLLLDNGKVVAHLVHAWPGDAIKVTAREALPADASSHVLVAYDGSGNAAAMKVFLDGRAAALDVASDTLRGTTVTAQRLRIGRRSIGSPLDGDLGDIRVYRRTLTSDEARALVGAPVSRIARMPAGARSKVQQELLTKTVRDRSGTGFARRATRWRGSATRSPRPRRTSRP